ncbi:hypothetical protein pdam_00004738 [Pocillopora damicornis]|uniref:Receptor ligand binding region domain-containing protein n=1 Tax=Pocillopora damicornis TaxID=46731 RepID=A0A3M6UER3_POCDA|nr:hypothetical protein pdam_00004738 [Pocillopora damicornis]
MTYLILVFGILVLAPPLIKGASKPLPTVYIQMDLKYTWSEFCLLETYFKAKMADLVLDDHGHHLNVSQIYINNFDENCPPKNNVDKASPKFYIIKPGGAYDEVNKNATIKAYETLRYLTDNNLGVLAGPLFQRKIEKVEAKGEDAPPKPTGFTELERTYIAIGIACGILAIIVSIAVIVYVIKNKKNGGRTNENKSTREFIGEENRLHTSPEFIGEENRLHASPPHNVS